MKLELFASVTNDGCLITETECGCWVSKRGKLVEDDAGDIYDATGDGALEVAELLSAQAGEQVAVGDVRAVWAKIRG